MKVSTAIKSGEQVQVFVGYSLVGKVANGIPAIASPCQPPETQTRAIVVHVDQYNNKKTNRITEECESYFDADDTLMSLQTRMRLLATVSQPEETSGMTLINQVSH